MEDFSIETCDQSFLKGFDKFWVSATIISIATEIIVSVVK